MSKFNTKRLYEILEATTMQLRKGEVLEGTPELVEQVKRGDEELTGGGVLEVFAMPHVDEAPEHVEIVDVELLAIAVNRVGAQKARDELIEILNDYPRPDRLAKGPSYIEVGAEIGDQGAAFQLFALGKYLGLWDIITPGTLKITGEKAREMAGLGFVMITGYTP